ncbi:hypothetical protein [Lysobacter claricitrinus]|uniref:hypothetical protein n=1 Tax=Lysobacter claricitrinus TaxID=3367728 RepID=UPI0038B26E53
MSSSTLDAPAETGTDEQRIDLVLRDGRHLVVLCRIHYGANVPVVGPPKPPKGPTLQFPVDDAAAVTIETAISAPS